MSYSVQECSQGAWGRRRRPTTQQAKWGDIIRSPLSLGTWGIQLWVTLSRCWLLYLYFPTSKAAVIVQSLSHVHLFATPWTAARQASLSSTILWSLLKFMSIAVVMLSNHVIFCHPFLLLTSIFPRLRIFSNESALHIRWPQYWNFSFSICPYSKYPRQIIC